MCYVAAGRVDAYTQEGIHVWDMAAGDVIVREAGGVVWDTEGTVEVERGGNDKGPHWTALSVAMSRNSCGGARQN